MACKINRLSWRLALLFFLLLDIPAANAEGNNQGFIYGRVVDESGTEYTGFLRWCNQEAFWDDLFHSNKEDLPYFDYLDEEDYRDLRRGRERDVSFFKKLSFVFKGDDDFASRLFISRFGDIESIEPRGESKAVVRMKNGSKYDVSGYSDDVTSKIYVNDASLGDIDLRWDRIELIEFRPAPKNADPGVWRLYGRVETDNGDFEGYIQWDKQECLNIDELDGDTEDGDVSIQMGRIRTIESRGKRSCLVTLDDGREIRMSGTNDVNHENRGIMVEDHRFGRVTIDWEGFDQITFLDPPGSGTGYNDYPRRGSLAGAVSVDNGERHYGRIVFDLDESEGWEIFNGRLGDVYFNIPFHRVASLEPYGRNRCRVVLSNGEELTLEDSNDVSRDNSGILIFKNDDDDPVYVKWKEVERIEFDHQN